MSKITYKCLDNPAHSFWESNNMEGITCPVCQFQVVPIEYYEPEYNQLPSYSDLKKPTIKKNKFANLTQKDWEESNDATKKNRRTCSK